MTAPATIDITPTWAAILPGMLAAYESSANSPNTRAMLLESFMRMAKTADYYVALVKTPAPIVPPKERLHGRLDAMARNGSHFSGALAKAWQYADSSNHALLWSVFAPLLMDYGVFLAEGTVTWTCQKCFHVNDARKTTINCAACGAP